MLEHRVIRIENPGAEAMAFRVDADADCAGWVILSPSEGTVPPGGNLSVRVSAKRVAWPRKGTVRVRCGRRDETIEIHVGAVRPGRGPAPWAWIAGGLLAVAVCGAALFYIAVPRVHRPKGTLDFYSASVEPRPGAMEAAYADGSARKVYLIDRLALYREDISKVEVSDEASGRPALVVEFNGEGTRRLASTTRELAKTHDLMAILVDGKVVTAARLMEPILGGKVQLEGPDLTSRQLQDMAEDFSPR